MNTSREASVLCYLEVLKRAVEGVGMAAKRGKSGMPQSVARSELKVYRVGSTEGRIPVPSNLRKQISLTNLAVLTDAEKKMQLYEPKWCDDMSRAATGQLKTGKPKAAGVGGAGGTPLSRNLSKSDHSLFQGKPKTFAPLAAPGKSQSRIPRGPYVEVKPLSKTSDDCKSDDDILSSKAKASGKKVAAACSGDPEGKGQGEEGGDKPFLKVDPELVVTVLGDLEQLLFSQMLGEYDFTLHFHSHNLVYLQNDKRSLHVCHGQSQLHRIHSLILFYKVTNSNEFMII